MIQLQNLTPEIYYKQSRDFQLLGRLYDVILNSIKTNADLLRLVPEHTQDMGTDLISLMATTLGFEMKHQYPTRQIAAICSVFSRIIKTKGTLEAVQIVGAAILRSEGITDQFVCTKRDNVLEVFLPEDLSDTTLFTDLLNYILPAGLTCKIVRANLASVKALDEILLTNDENTVSVITHNLAGASLMPTASEMAATLKGRKEYLLDTKNHTKEEIDRARLSWLNWDLENPKPLDGLMPNASVIGVPVNFDSDALMSPNTTAKWLFRKFATYIPVYSNSDSPIAQITNTFLKNEFFNSKALPALYDLFGSYSYNKIDSNKDKGLYLDSGRLAVSSRIPLPTGYLDFLNITSEDGVGKLWLNTKSTADTLNRVFATAAYHAEQKEKSDFIPNIYFEVVNGNVASATDSESISSDDVVKIIDTNAQLYFYNVGEDRYAQPYQYVPMTFEFMLQEGVKNEVLTKLNSIPKEVPTNSDFEKNYPEINFQTLIFTFVDAADSNNVLSSLAYNINLQNDGTIADVINDCCGVTKRTFILESTESGQDYIATILPFTTSSKFGLELNSEKSKLTDQIKQEVTLIITLQVNTVGTRSYSALSVPAVRGANNSDTNILRLEIHYVPDADITKEKNIVIEGLWKSFLPETKTSETSELEG